MSTRQFAVRCAASNGPDSTPTSLDDAKKVVDVTHREPQSRTLAGGLEEVVVVPDAKGEGLTIRGLAPGESKEAVRGLVEDQIYDATLDLIILQPGVWVDEGVRR
jgi:hypothetical protein